jgi:hypothetical protein
MHSVQGRFDKSVPVKRKRKRLLLREFGLWKICGAESLRRRGMERVEGIEPSYSAWKSENLVVLAKAILTFSVFLTH